ncbi:hypothetical protein CMUS01_16556 [Colletotrichum musicola]|uniref:Uncharacterized protein n=1 Tax=Colletotrichum musicola TaxID=2175873 RepID=A0A8H6IMX7_9PEZI|nr:hypothetical protein CMUS01_16556 [Colletotrichum musicola]
MEIRNNLYFDPFAENAGYDSDPCPVDLKGIDWSDPSSFMKLMSDGGRIPEKLSPDKILKQTQQRKSSIFNSYDTLRDILDRHELTIWKRWSKKSRQQRFAILLPAWPNMPESHRPDFKAFRVESKKQREAGTRFRSHFFWPHVNQEDLCKPKILPMLLNARARRPPWAFAAADREAMQFGCVTKALVPGFLNLYTMVLNNPGSRDGYAELLTWEGDFNAMNLATSRKEFLPGEGLLVLEAQDKLLEFLVDCCRKILCDIPGDDLIGDTFPIQPEPEMKFGVDVAGFASLAVMTEEAPYRPPAILDLGKLEELL